VTNRTVLVVEDDAAQRVLLKAILRRDGYDVVEATNGQEALDHLAARSFHAVILDLMMRRVSGHEILQHLAKVAPSRRNVIVLTAASERYIRDIDRTVVRTVMRKPFDLDDLREKLTGLGGRRLLLVEDNTADQYLVERQLKREGYELTIAPDGRDALQRLKTDEYDAVIVDLKLPVVSGYDVIDFIHSKPSPPKTIVLTMVDHFERPVVADAILHKPAGIDALVDTLATSLP
jgi:two-component system, sensor histidine kinase and response regulator